MGQASDDSPPTSQQLLAKLKANDASASAWFERQVIVPFIRLVARRLTDETGEEYERDAEDIVFEALEKTLKAYRSDHPSGAKFTTLLWTVVQTLTLNWLRDRSVTIRRQIELDEERNPLPTPRTVEDVVLDALVPEEPDPQTGRMKTEIIMLEMAALTPAEEFVVTHLMEGFTVEEIAHLLNVHPNGVRAALREARRKLLPRLRTYPEFGKFFDGDKHRGAMVKARTEVEKRRGSERRDKNQGD